MAQSTKGQRLTYDIETSLGVASGSPKDIRVEGNPDVGNPFKTSLQPATLTADVHEVEKPVTIDIYRDDAVKLSVYPRQASSGTSFLVTALLSGGYTQSIGSADTTVTGTPAVDSLELTADQGAIGRAVYLEVTGQSGRYTPVLAANYGGNIITPSMDLAVAPTAADNVLIASTIYPGSPGQVDTDKTLTIKQFTRAANGSNVQVATASGCSLSALGAIVWEGPGTIPKFELSFRAAQITNETAASLGSNDFADVEALKVIDCNSSWEFADADAAGGITRETINVLRATFTPGWKTSPIMGFGSSCLGGIEGHVSGPSEDMAKHILEIEILWNSDRISDWEGTNPDKYIAFTQPSASPGNLGLGVFFPRCHLLESPTWSRFDGDYHKATLRYSCTSAGYSGTTDADAGNQPFYLVLPTA